MMKALLLPRFGMRPRAEQNAAAVPESSLKTWT
jgi:hypothetical protein